MGPHYTWSLTMGVANTQVPPGPKGRLNCRSIFQQDFKLGLTQNIALMIDIKVLKLG